MSRTPARTTSGRNAPRVADALPALWMRRRGCLSGADGGGGGGGGGSSHSVPSLTGFGRRGCSMVRSARVWSIVRVAGVRVWLFCIAVRARPTQRAQVNVVVVDCEVIANRFRVAFLFTTSS
eukprot:6283948-Prymnesium_polylepis.1